MDQRTTTRLAGVGGILFVALSFVSGGGPFFDDISNARAVQWVQDHHDRILAQGLAIGFQTTLVAALVGVLLHRTGRRSPAVVAGIVALGALVAVDWVSAVCSFALADVGQRSDADQAILALFSVSKDMTYADGYVAGVAFLVASVLALRTRTLPTPIAVLGIAVGLWHLVEQPLQVALTRTPEGPTGPIGVVGGVLWILATSLVLIARPAATPAPTTAPRSEAALAG
jgi:hypothetical protein